MNAQKFFVCKHCGNLVGLIHNARVALVCCGEPMQELVPNTVEASAEKHLPVAHINGRIVDVTVGAVDHPMLEEHHILWIYLQTNQGGQRKGLAVGAAPKVQFALADGEQPQAVFAYCNLHGLWKTAL